MFDHQASGPGFGAGTSAAAPHEHWQGAVRELPASQLHHFQWHLLRLEDGSRRSRYPTSEAFLRAYRRHADGTNTVVFGCFVDGHMRGAVELRPLQRDGCRTAEITFSVESAWRERGIGTALMEEVIRAARERGIEHLYFSCHALNRRMQRIAERFTARIGFEDCAYFADIMVRQKPMAPVRCEPGSEKELPDNLPDNLIVLDFTRGTSEA